MSTSRSVTWARHALATRRSPRQNERPLDADACGRESAAPGAPAAGCASPPTAPARWTSSRSRSALRRDDHQFVEVARGGVLDVGGGVRRDALVQHRLVVEAGQRGHRRRVVERDAIELDGQDRPERLERLERVGGFGGRGGRVHQNQPQMPRPVAVGIAQPVRRRQPDEREDGDRPTGRRAAWPARRARRTRARSRASAGWCRSASACR